MTTASERLAAGVAVVLGLAALVLAVIFLARQFPDGLIVLGLLSAAAGFARFGLRHKGRARLVGFCGVAVTLAFSVVMFVRHGSDPELILLIAVTASVGIFAASRAFSVRVPLPAVDEPSRPVLFFNPKSGDGKAEKFSLAEEARRRGIRPIELEPDVDFEDLVRSAVEDGANGLAMAGGDGSQAIVAAIAAEHDLPFACVPSGTRNHFALDLGVDRDDVVGAMDAFVDGGEFRVDLAEVNGRVFVNNVSLGIYAEALQRDEYRQAKLKTILDTLPQIIGPEADEPPLAWKSPSGRRHRSAAAILVSNNRYRLGHAIGSGTRPRMDRGCLGIAVLADPADGTHLRTFWKPWRDWSTPEFEIEAERPVPAGIDGEAARLDPPLRFRTRKAALRVRVARAHPGASPSAAVPDGPLSFVLALIRIMTGRRP